MRDESADLFICHVTADDQFVNLLSARLEAETLDGTPHSRQLRAFYDHRDMRGGDAWRARLLDSVRHARFLVVLVCPEIEESEFTQEEIATHSSVRLNCLIPLWVRDRRSDAMESPSGIPRRFRPLHCLDFRDAVAFEKNFPKLLERLRVPVADQVPHDDFNEPDPFDETRSLAKAFQAIREFLCVVFADASGCTPIAIAWVEAHRFVALPSRGISDAKALPDWIFVRGATNSCERAPVQVKRLPTSEPRSGWVRYKAPVYGRLPPPATIAPLLVSKEIGVVFLRVDAAESKQPVLGFAAVEIRSWSTPGGAIVTDLDSMSRALVLDGMPLFDHRAQLVGCLHMAPSGCWLATPYCAFPESAT